jgi:uncharacterized protein YegL
LKIEVPDHS